jgi:hypothetical protein
MQIPRSSSPFSLNFVLYANPVRSESILRGLNPAMIIHWETRVRTTQLATAISAISGASHLWSISGVISDTPQSVF